ncbi:carnitinyl-dehydratase [Colletotrichum incanum]|nr:carnitinyl-dehydratase [Colletotrichum incanum]
MDLKERLDIIQSNGVPYEYPSGGFTGFSKRAGRKPINVACNGYAHGDGFEAILNEDVTFASPNAKFCLPEVLRGLSALAGALPRSMLLFGNHWTMELVLTGRIMSVEEAHI